MEFKFYKLRSVLVFLVLVQGIFGVGFNSARKQVGDFFVSVKGRVNSKEAQKKPYVILISIDAYRSDYTDKYHPPTLEQMRAEGASAPFMLPIFPSKTFTNHWSIVTGMYAGKHGIVGNSFYDPIRKDKFQHSLARTAEDGTWYGGEPLWATAEKQGMLTATFFWPGSGAEVGGMRPTYYYHFSDQVDHAERVTRLHEWLTLPEAERPHLMTFYFWDVDRAGHHFGPDSPEVEKAIQKVDQTLGQMFAEIAKSQLPVDVIVLSDHGMVTLDATKFEYLDDRTDLSSMQVVGKGSQSFLYLKDIKDQSKLAQIEKDLKKGKGYSVYRPSELPKEWHLDQNPRVGNLIINVQNAPLEVGMRNPPPQMEKGSHGYDPATNSTMQAIFYAKGPQIRPNGRVKPFQNIHVYPWVLKLLGLKNPDSKLVPIDGDVRVLAPLLRE